MPQEAWAKVRKDKNAKVEWTRFRQKQMPKEGLFVEGEFHSGAHMNLVVFTVNAKPLMSDEAEATAKKKKKRKILGVLSNVGTIEIAIQTEVARSRLEGRSSVERSSMERSSMERRSVTQ